MHSANGDESKTAKVPVLPKVIWEELRRKVPINYNGTPQIHSPKVPLPFNDNHPI